MNTRTDVEHRWFEYGRWFYGYGSSMEGHRHNERGARCEWRTITVTIHEEVSEWQNENPAVGK